MALNWKQPYASLVLLGSIYISTWATAYRGLVLICTDKKHYSERQIIDISGLQQYNRIYKEILKEDKKTMLKLRGHAIGIAELIDCRTMDVYDENNGFCNYDPLLYAHIYKSAKAIKPIPWQGSKGWNNVDPAFLNQIEFI